MVFVMLSVFIMEGPLRNSIARGLHGRDYWCVLGILSTGLLTTADIFFSLAYWGAQGQISN